MAGIRVVASPVVFTNNSGTGVGDEVQAPSDSIGARDFVVGEPVQAAWWVPLDNISDLPAIHMIQTVPDGTNVKLLLKGLPGQRDARVRILIYAAT
jgi:hypothetical protein